jgi:hypothetical protein
MLDALCQTGFWLRAELIHRLLVEAGEKSDRWFGLGSCVTDDSREGFSGVIYHETGESVIVVTAYFDTIC